MGKPVPPGSFAASLALGPAMAMPPPETVAVRLDEWVRAVAGAEPPTVRNRFAPAHAMHCGGTLKAYGRSLRCVAAPAASESSARVLFLWRSLRRNHLRRRWRAIHGPHGGFVTGTGHHGRLGRSGHDRRRRPGILDRWRCRAVDAGGRRVLGRSRDDGRRPLLRRSAGGGHGKSSHGPEHERRARPTRRMGHRTGDSHR